MKITKLKSYLFSLMAVTMLTVFLSSCEKDKVEEPVKQETPSELVEITEPNTNANSFKDMHFEGYESTIFNDNISKKIELNGKLLVNENGKVSGSVSTLSDDGTVDGKITFDNEIVIFEAKDGIVRLDLLSEAREIIVNDKNNVNKAINTSDAIDKLIENSQSQERFNEFSLADQAMSAYMAIFSSEAWIANAQYSEFSDNIGIRGCSWWRRGIAIAVAGAIAGVASTGCIALTGGCTALTVSVVFAGVSVPCWLLNSVCWGGVFIGGSATQQLVENWLC